MKKIAFALLAATTAFITASCQRSGALNSKTSEPMIINTVADENGALPGKFSVGDTKKVQFSQGNLFWDGIVFKFEDNQYDFPVSWDESHVSLFFWSNNASAAYSSNYIDNKVNSGNIASSNIFFTNEADTTAQSNFIVNGVQGRYRMLSSTEWAYLRYSRTNASSLYKCGVTVCGKANCLILAPDDFSGTIASAYDASNWPAAEAAGLVCLPAAGTRNGSDILSVGEFGSYWTSTTYDYSSMYCLFIYSDNVYHDYRDGLFSGNSVRLITESK